VAAAIASRARQVPAIPGDALLHPAPLLAITLLVVNDHVLKAAWPGVVTGKLSDVAGLFFFPLLLVAIAEVTASFLKHRQILSPRHLQAAVAATALVFTGVKLVPEVNATMAWLLGAAQRLGGLALGGASPSITPVSIARDPTDLVALPVLAVAFAIGMRRYREGSS
jgi:hypothetical protein